MPNTAGTLRAIVQRRVRDTSGTMHTDSFVLDLLSRAQRQVNAGAQIVLQTTSLTTAIQQLVYSVDSDLTAAVDVLKVRDNGHDLDEVTLDELKVIDPQWFRAIGPEFQLFAKIGRTLLVVYPAKSIASSVSVVSSRLTTVLSVDGTSLEIEADKDLIVSDMVEVMLLLRQRDLAQAQEAIKKLAVRFVNAKRVNGVLP